MPRFLCMSIYAFMYSPSERPKSVILTVYLMSSRKICSKACSSHMGVNFELLHCP